MTSHAGGRTTAGKTGSHTGSSKAAPSAGVAAARSDTNEPLAPVVVGSDDEA